MKKITPFALMLLTLIACNNSNSRTAPDTTENRTTEDSLQAKTPDTNDTSLPVNKTAALVKATLSDLYKDDLAKNVVDTASRKFIFSEQDLNGDGKNEIFVGTTGPYFCGSGGCTILLLGSDGKLVNRFTVIGYPVFVTNEKTHGWNNLVVSSGNKKRLLKFDGQKYPTNPSTQPVYDNTVNDQLPRALDMDNERNRWFTF